MISVQRYVATNKHGQCPEVHVAANKHGTCPEVHVAANKHDQCPEVHVELCKQAWSVSRGGKVPSDEELAFLLEDRAFADYFNIFLSLPIFGQHIFYNFIEREFQYDPQIRRRRNHVDRREVIRFLRTTRFPLFQSTCLIVEYNLCTKLRDVEVDTNHKLSGKQEDKEVKSVFCRNILGHALGMRMFREYLSGTSGEKTFRCWCDIERWRLSADGSKTKTEMLHRIKTLYISDGGQSDLLSHGKTEAFSGRLNFQLIPEAEVEKELISKVGCDPGPVIVESDEGLIQLQKILLAFLRRYWVPRYVIHLYNTLPKDSLSILNRETPFDITAQSRQRHLRCKLMFPRIYSSKTSAPGSPVTPVFVSNDASQMPTVGAESSLSCQIVQSEEASSFSLPEEHSEKEDTNLDPQELLALWGGHPLPRDEGEIDNDLGKVSSDENALKELDSWEKIQTPSSPLSALKSPLKAVFSLPLTSYMAGRRRFSLGRFPGIETRMLCSFASDPLAGSPFLQFLKSRYLLQDMKLLEFWNDVRHFLDTDENYVDPFGTPMKKALGKIIAEKYLMESPDRNDIFPEALKMSILRSLSFKDDITLLSTVQDLITGALRDSWQEYIYHERRKFRKLVCRKKPFDRNVIESNIWPENIEKDTLFFCNVKSPPPAANQASNGSDDVRSHSADPKTSLSTSSRPWSRFTESGTFALSEDHFVRAFEYAVVCSEYGRSGMYSDKRHTSEELIDALYSDYGSIHIQREPAVRNEALHKLTHKPKIDIENIRVSRKVMYETPEMVLEKVGERFRSNRLVLRRRGILIERPPRPRNFIDVLQSPIQFEFFKRFMMNNKAVYPLMFWRHVEDLKESTSARHKSHLVQVIYRKYFSKSAKQGYLLDCTDDIILQIPSMDRVPASVLICAQASVFRSMERKWYCKYLETYPPDSDDDGDTPPPPEPSSPDLNEPLKHPQVSKVKRPKTKKTLHLWNGFVHLIMDFMSALKNPYEVKLLELYLKNEQEKDSKMQPVEFVFPNLFDSRFNSLASGVYLYFYRFKKQVDDVKHLENITKDDMTFLSLKAKAIVDCYLQSEVVPRVQVNVPVDLAANIANHLTTQGPTRGLFHDATILLFPILYFFWRRDEWLKGHDPEAFYTRLQSQLTRPWRASTPHKDTEGPDYINIRESNCQIINAYLPEEESFRISFSITDGVRYMYPGAKAPQRTGRKSRKGERGKDSQLSVTSESPKKQNRKLSKAMDTLYEGSVRNLDMESEYLSSLDKKEFPPEEPLEQNKPPEVKRVRPSVRQGRALKISQLVEALNKGATGSIKQRTRTFDEVVRAALTSRLQSTTPEHTDAQSFNSMVI
ncbi:hypothetical protein FSP39_014682 [Pinctada imbricata]|uniref:RGS domain-containing protein n=1 Tax=Pinctada imbricata TaxID=66713 RepID=A0AA89BM21_PINIB|nr:hypothetical protein FSP39_014682 [Pinctada imbricata]